MEHQTKKVPKLRFPEFTSEWEEKKLGEVVDRVTRKNKELESTLALTISAQDGLVAQYDFFDKIVASKDVSGYYLILKDEFAYNKSYSKGYPWGAIKKLEKYDKGVLSTLYIIFKVKDIDKDFLAIYYETDKWYKEISLHAAEGARNHGLLNVPASDFFDTNLVVPVLSAEQQKIGEFFQMLDTQITAQQQKITNLKQQKKGLLQKMFPQSGQNIPQVRFAGFTQPWEEKKLGEISSIKTGSSDLQDAEDNGKYPFFVRSEKVERSNRYIFDGEAILIPGEGRLGEIFHYIKGKFDYHQRVYKISDFENYEVYGKYILYFMNNSFKKYALQFTSKATVDSLRLPILQKYKIMIPELKEQQKIGEFFQQFDALIAAQEQKLDHLQQRKKALLQQMFV